ncbi:cytochrome b-c1 complex subunit 6, mitochondrial-like [Lucilia sericata]|uniref:cytochrome b-c1 complex subunit 6, mitochondrial-like n=1 Tax=Lucilia sericata TaxID=13632 RepID=UPI0018A82D1B|nr:cytochrome b-c1 complex subunit 6, mitochondrial-like [Lucilia sericata]
MNFKQFWTFNIQAAPPEQQSSQEAQAELVDQQKELRDFCDKKRKIYRLYETLQKCNKRVNSRQQTRETCEQELFDYVQALDHCVAKMLFPQLV